MKREIAAQTFTPTYDEIEDRLRFVINYQDIQNRVDFMITRSFIINLISTAEEFVEKHYVTDDFGQNTSQTSKKVQESENSSKDHENRQESKNEIMSKTDSVNLELLKTNEELLREVNFSFDANSNHTLLILSSSNITVKANLDGFMLMQVFQVMKSAIPYIKWGISHNF